jgi:hypothetical protein
VVAGRCRSLAGSSPTASTRTLRPTSQPGLAALARMPRAFGAGAPTSPGYAICAIPRRDSRLNSAGSSQFLRFRRPATGPPRWPHCRPFNLSPPFRGQARGNGCVLSAEVSVAIASLDFRWAAFATLIVMLQIPLVAMRWHTRGARCADDPCGDHCHHRHHQHVLRPSAAESCE